MSRPSPETLRIAIVTGSLSRLAGGLFDAVRRPALELRGLGHTVEVLSLADEYCEEDKAAWAPLVPLAAPRLGPGSLAYSPSIARALSKGGFDLVHQHGIWQAFSAQVSRWRRRCGKPVMISPHGMLDSWALANSGWKKRLAGTLYEQANLGKARCLHALNTSEAASLRRFGLANPVATIANGADLPTERPLPRPGWWPVGKVMLFIARIHPKKGVSELVEGFARFATTPAGSQWHCVIAGWDDGGHADPLRRTIAQLAMQDRIHFPGALFGADKEAALSHADAFVLPSHSEGLPMTVLEAWSWRLPVLMTRQCNLPEGFAANAAIEITPDPVVMAQTFARRLGEAEALKSMGENGRALVEQRFTWPQIARHHEQVYRWMAGRTQETPACVVHA